MKHFAIGVAVGALVCASGAQAARLLTGADIRDGSLTGKDIRNHTLTRADFRGALRRRDVPGPAGPAGPAGARGEVGVITTVRSGPVDFETDEQNVVVYCPEGQRVLGGGGTNSAGYLAASRPTSNRPGWYVAGVDVGAQAPVRPIPTVEAFALCAR